MRRRCPHLLAAEQLVPKPGFAWIVLQEVVFRLIRAMLRFAGVTAEGDLRDRPENSAQPLELIVCERVHRVEQQCSNTGAKRPLGLFFKKRVEDGHQETLGLAGTSPGADDQVSAREELTDRRFLVNVERLIQ